MKVLNQKQIVLYSTTAFFITLVLFSGCKKNFLERQPQGAYTQDTYPYPTGSGPYDTYLFGAYSDLRSFNVHSQSFIAATSIRSDDADKGSTPADGGANALQMDNFPIMPDNGFVNTIWNGYFSLINKSNIALDQIKNNNAIVATPVQKVQAEGEARFLRAYAYFNLVRFFGRVPIVDSVFANVSQSNVPQSNSAAVYAFIEGDLQFAAANLPLNWEAKFVGRATSGAANGLLAKVYLTQNKWAQAMSAANAVMTSGQYNLSTPYDRIFREEGENSSESIFEVQATASAAVPTANGVQYAQIQGVRGTNTWNLGWGWNTPSPQLADAYEPGDPRRARTILFTSTSTTPGVTIYGETTPTGLPNPMYNQKVYTNPQLRATYSNNFGYWMNVRILRYADVVLMYAEAANELGGAANIEAAKAALNSVRARARAGNASILPDVTTDDQDELRQAIWQERRVELAMEHDRFWDIVRWGIAQDVLHAAGKTNFNPSRDVLLPIPQVQIDLSQGVLTQNPGY
jgi:starch-binding outer membrane protein, SusD/RagB family